MNSKGEKKNKKRFTSGPFSSFYATLRAGFKGTDATSFDPVEPGDRTQDPRGLGGRRPGAAPAEGQPTGPSWPPILYPRYPLVHYILFALLNTIMSEICHET